MHDDEQTPSGPSIPAMPAPDSTPASKPKSSKPAKSNADGTSATRSSPPTPARTRLIGIVRGLEKQGTASIMPDDLAHPILQAQIKADEGASDTDQTALVERKGKVSRVATAEDAVNRSLTRLERILNGVIPEGNEGRSDFFPGGPGPHDEVVRCDRFLAGMKKHAPKLPDRILPANLRPDVMRAAVLEVRESRAARDDARATKKETSPVRKDVSLTTRTLARRATEFLRGYFETDVELAQYGLVRRGGRRS